MNSANQHLFKCLAAFGVLALHLSGSNLYFAGTLETPENTFTQTFTIGATQNIEIVTWGFGGGVDAEGTIIQPGGFDPLVALYSGDLTHASIVTIAGNPVAGADTLGGFVGHCPPAGMVTIGTGAGSSICGDVLVTADNLAPGTYTLLLSDANYIPLSVDPGPPSSSLLSDGFSDFTGGVFQTCNSTSVATTCITPTGNFAVDILGSSSTGGPSLPEPRAWALAATGLVALAANKRMTKAEGK
jgi:hypothetical protein